MNIFVFSKRLENAFLWIYELLMLIYKKHTYNEKLLFSQARSNHQGFSIKKAILNIFVIFTGNHPFWNLFTKKRLQDRCFPVYIVKFLRTSILKNICEQLFLTIVLIVTPTEYPFQQTQSFETKKMWSALLDIENFNI